MKEWLILLNFIIPIDDKGKPAADATLLTKILLGVFGFIPAFDTNFLTTSSDKLVTGTIKKSPKTTMTLPCLRFQIIIL